MPWHRLVAVWNERAGELPHLAVGCTAGAKRDDLARRLWLEVQRRVLGALGHHDDDAAIELVADAVARCAEDPFYARNRHGFDAFCRHADRWLDVPGQADRFNPDTFDHRQYPDDHPFQKLWSQS